MLHQTFQPGDLFLVFVLVVLEGLLSIDNALVLGLLARRLAPRLQTKALTYGLIGSFVFRLVAIFAAAWLLKWRFVKLLGGGYLIYIAVKHLLTKSHKRRPLEESNQPLGFWSVVASIELTDVAFAADSILAGIALVGPIPPNTGSNIHPKLWVILLGGMIGVLLMRVAAVGFIRLLKRFPGFELTAYLLVGLVGLKLLADWQFNATEHQLDFESPSAPAFIVFWSLMLLCVLIGFVPKHRPVSFPPPSP
jgi:YkoY family integral membrane protein